MPASAGEGLLDKGGNQDSGEDVICSYGPDDCTPRETLLQWSYGTSFSGGPDVSEPLVTDRPDFAESTTTVGRGVTQLELGYTYVYDNDGVNAARSQSCPELLARVGIFAEWLELRVGWTYFEERIAGGTSTNFSGSEDLSVGLKIALTPQEGLLPEMAFIPQMSLPTGADVFTTGEVLPGGIWNYSWEINDCVAMAGQTVFNRALDLVTGKPFMEFAQSWTIAYSLTEKVGGYTEWFVIVPDGADTDRTRHFFNGGLTYLVHNDLQLDFRGGVRLSDASEDYFAGTGLSRRF